MYNYAPNFENFGGAYCYWLVRVCVCGWVGGSHFCMPPVILEPYALFKNLVNKIRVRISKTISTRVLIFSVLIGAEE